jgi:hypothetical protein
MLRIAMLLLAAATSTVQAEEGMRTVIEPATGGLPAAGGPRPRKAHLSTRFLRSGSSDLFPALTLGTPRAISCEAEIRMG